MGCRDGATPRFFTEKPLVVVLGIGACLRIALHIALWPTVIAQPDPWLYLNAADNGVFSDPIHPAGYALLLRGLRPLSPDPVVVVALQHALGLMTAGLVYASARRLGASPLWSTLPASVLALSLDQVLVEHTLISDSTFVLFVVLAVHLFVRWRHDPESRLGWLVVAGAVTACAMLVRGTAPVLMMALVAAAAAARPRSIGQSILRGGAVVGGMAAVTVPYLVAQHSVTGQWAFTEGSGWSIYTRVAPFARCEVANPPPDTRFLCEDTAPSTRGGPDFYAWTGGPARARYGDFDEGNDELRRFSSAVLRRQFGDYLMEVTTDFARYFTWVEARHDRGGGNGGSALRVDASWEPVERNTLKVIEAYYGDIDPVRREGVVDALAGVQPLLRVSRYPLLVALLMAFVGMAKVARRRRAIAFLVVVATGSLLFSVAVSTYNWRYALPWIPLFFLAAALSGDGLARRRRTPANVIAAVGGQTEKSFVVQPSEGDTPEVTSIRSP